MHPVILRCLRLQSWISLVVTGVLCISDTDMASSRNLMGGTEKISILAAV